MELSFEYTTNLEPCRIVRSCCSTLPNQPSSIERVEAYGNVDIRTAEEVVRGDRGVYNPNTGLARLLEQTGHGADDTPTPGTPPDRSLR